MELPEELLDSIQAAIEEAPPYSELSLYSGREFVIVACMRQLRALQPGVEDRFLTLSEMANVEEMDPYA